MDGRFLRRQRSRTIPVYTYFCDPCDEPAERTLPISRYDEPQTCETCGGSLRRTVARTNFNLAGDGWPSKNIRVKDQMAAKNRVLDAKMAEKKNDGVGIKLTPNVGGEVTGTWREAAQLAASQGKDPTGYVAKASKEP